MYFLNRLAPDAAFYNVPVAFRLRGPLSRTVLQDTVNALVDRHEALRTTFEEQDGEVLQVISASREAIIEVTDLSTLADRHAIETEARRLVMEGLQRPFDLVRGPLIVVRLLRLADQDHVLQITLHHIIVDGWSVGLLLRDFSLLYSALSRDEASPLQPLAIQYADCSEAQREWMQNATASRQLAYWRHRLAALEPVELLGDRPRPANESHRGATEMLVLPPRLSTALANLGQRLNATLFTILLAGFKVLLSRYTDMTDISVGTPVANRPSKDMEEVVGFFVNSVVLRSSLDGNPRFADVVETVGRTAIAAFEHQDLPFEQLVEALHPDRSLGHNPLFRIMFAVQNAQMEQLRLDGLTVEPFASGNQSARFDIEFHVWQNSAGVDGLLWESASGLRCVVNYSTDLYDAVTIRHLLERYQRVMDAVATDPFIRCKEIPLAGENEAAILTQWNRTDAPLHATTLPELLQRVDVRDDRPAILWRDMALDHGTVRRRSNQLAHLLRRRGIGPEVVVGLGLPRTPDLILCMLAILKAGGAYAAIDPRYPDERRHALLRDSRAAFVIVATRDARAAPGVAMLALDELAAEWDAAPDDQPEVRLSPSHLAYLIYTSGSTGQPKGVMIQHGNAAALLSWAVGHMEIASLEAVLASSSVTFDLSVYEIFLPLVAGTSLCLVDNVLELPTTARHGVTLVNTVPSAFLALLRNAEVPPSVRTVNLAGESLSGELVRQILALGHVRTVNDLYGPSETTTYSTSAVRQAEGSPVIGRGIGNTTVHVLDAGLRPVPIGVAGELHIGGLGVARGYTGQPAATAARFLPSPFASRPGERIYRTGDRVRWRHDGQLEFLGRQDDQVKIRGFRIEPGEIAASLARAPEVADAVVTALPYAADDASRERRLVAYVVARPEPRTDHGSSASRHVDTWRELYQDIYATRAQRPRFHTVGWNSSLTGQPFPDAEMAQWVAHTVRRIRALRGRRILEIGCGTGLLLFRLAPTAQCYVGRDFSPAALAHIDAHLPPPLRERVHLAEAAADDVSGLAPASFDTVILNSVVQYFPSVDYLLTVLDRAISLTAPGGAVFLGDLRHLGLLEDFHHAVLQAQRIAPTPERLRRAVQAERELAIDPGLPSALAAADPRIARVEIRLRTTRADNELTRYRYDAILHIGPTPPAETAAARWLDWSDGGLAAVSAALAARPDHLGVLGIPHRSLVQHHLQPDALTPRALLRHAWAHGYRLATAWADGGSGGRFDAMLSRDGLAGTPALPIEQPPSRVPAWPALANDPGAADLQQRLAPLLRRHLAECLPEHMMPGAFVFLERLPRTANGKIDRRALPAPEFAPAASTWLAPRSSTERQLAGLWQEVLGCRRVSLNDNFFALGGHSLLALRLIARIRDALAANLSLRDFFASPTLADMARLVETRPASEHVTLVEGAL
ncbi:hypothetical protein WJ68_05660 [Burkholderia ubonensis]|uniref:Carrier domain-containing protein n=1 Tax=Burkholderia ubonensis TaxID=101571 RepID=A0ABD4E672_9BURK|nr:hypothetical protein WJ68_05660 [Burkholderia ubonensis]